jgi:hypothetical protein
MEALIDCLQAALALDLVGPDDFAPPRPAAPAPRSADHPRGMSRGHPAGGRLPAMTGLLLAASDLKVDTSSFLVIVATAALAATLAALAGLRNLFLPVVVIELVLGVVIGPQVARSRPCQRFTDFFSSLGLGMLFFFAGYEIDLGRIAGLPLRLALAAGRSRSSSPTRWAGSSPRSASSSRWSTSAPRSRRPRSAR